MISLSTIFLKDKKKQFYFDNVSESTATRSENYTIYWHVTCVRFQDFWTIFIQMTVCLVFSQNVVSLVVFITLGTGGCMNVYLFVHP